METPTLFDQDDLDPSGPNPAPRGADGPAAELSVSRNHPAGRGPDSAESVVRLQGRIRSLNEDRRARQDDSMRRARRRAAVARLRRRESEGEPEYWQRRRAELRGVPA